MANRAAELRTKAQATWPGATVHGRGRSWIRHQHPTQPNRYMLDTSIGSIHYEDAGQWLECETDWRNSDDANFADMADRAALKTYIKTDGTRRVYPRREVTTEYVEFGILQYWRTSGGGAWRSLPLGVKNRSADRLAWDGTDVSIALVSKPDALKLDITLKTAAAPTRIRWPVVLVGLTLNANLELVSTATGEVAGRIVQPVMIDANKTAGTVTATYAGGYIEYSANTTGLVYPIAIDPTIDTQIAATANDGALEWYGFCSATEGSLVITEGATKRVAWTRFPGISGLSGATIDAAYGEINIISHSGTGGTYTICAEDAATPAAPASWADYSGKTKTTALVTTDPGATTGWYGSAVEIKTIIQELADSYDPSAIQLFHGGGSGTYTGNLMIYDYNGNAANAAKLHIEYTSGGTPADPEGRLIGGKLIGGGLLMRGVLIGH